MLRGAYNKRQSKYQYKMGWANAHFSYQRLIQGFHERIAWIYCLTSQQSSAWLLYALTGAQYSFPVGRTGKPCPEKNQKPGARVSWMA